MSGQVEEISSSEGLLALIIRRDATASGVHFYTPDAFSQQVAAMGHPKGKVIPPHVHNPVSRNVVYTQEVLVIKSGVLRVDFYSSKREYLQSRCLGEGDIILLAKGGHGFEVLEDLQMVEIKQGPYAGDKDKTRFAPIEADKLAGESLP